MTRTIVNKASKYVYNFLDYHMGMYNNWHGIEFIVNNDDTVLVNYVIKDPLIEEYIEFGLSYTSNNFNDFMRDFGFNGTHALKALSPNRLWKMYYKGQVEIYCLLLVKVTYLMLSFRLDGNKMIVHDDNDKTYELNEILQTPRQFIEYTQQQTILASPTDVANSLRAIYNGNKQV